MRECRIKHPNRPARNQRLLRHATSISDAELVTLAVMQAVLGHTSERRWLRYARRHLIGMFPDLPGQSGYNKRLRKLGDTMSWLIGMLGADTSIATDDVWVAGASPSYSPSWAVGRCRCDAQ